MATEKTQPVNLTNTASFLRNTIKGLAILVVVLIFGRVALTSLINYWRALNPPPPPPPTMGFDALPKLVFPAQTDKPTSYTLETVGQQTPYISDRAKVFRFTPSRPDLSAAETARRKAGKLDYLFEPEIINSRTYRWTISNPILSTLEMDILTSTYTIKTNWPAYPNLLSDKKTISTSAGINQVKSILQQTETLSDDLAEGPARTSYIKAVGGRFTEADSLSEADFLQVDLYRKLIDLDPNSILQKNQTSPLFSSVTAEGKKGPISAVITSDGIILDMTMNLFPVEYDSVETYPIQSTQQAWKLLSGGEGYVAKKGSNDTATIRTIYMAYYEPPEEQQYYRPVYVFEGDGFIGFVDALDPRVIQK